jgi:hypothetical protein
VAVANWAASKESFYLESKFFTLTEKVPEIAILQAFFYDLLL